MSIASNRVSGSGMCGMTVDHTFIMLRYPKLNIELGNNDLELPAGHNRAPIHILR